jgi:hypothetical protein
MTQELATEEHGQNCVGAADWIVRSPDIFIACSGHRAVAPDPERPLPSLLQFVKIGEIRVSIGGSGFALRDFTNPVNPNSSLFRVLWCPLLSTHVHWCPLLSHSFSAPPISAKNPCYNRSMTGKLGSAPVSGAAFGVSPKAQRAFAPSAVLRDSRFLIDSSLRFHSHCTKWNKIKALSFSSTPYQRLTTNENNAFHFSFCASSASQRFVPSTIPRLAPRGHEALTPRRELPKLTSGRSRSQCASTLDTPFARGAFAMRIYGYFRRTQGRVVPTGGACGCNLGVSVAVYRNRQFTCKARGRGHNCREHCF